MTFTIDKVNLGVPPAEVALWRAIPLLSSLMNDVAFMDSHVLPLVEETAEDWYVAHRHDSPDGSYSLQIFVWPPGTETRIHDHSSWGDSSARSGLY
jgi:predicted metal-dependent enzyme (double-stranded beta helix superfamily)